MRLVHQVIGWAIVGSFVVLWLWSMATWLATRVARRGSGPGRPFWWLLGFVQVALVVQAVVGIVLLVLGGRVPLLHYVYGAVFPILLLAIAHVLARDDRFAARPWLVFGWASFFIFGLTFRALDTGLGLLG